MVRNVVIVGASSGLGKAVAEQLAGDESLVLLARSIKKTKVKRKDVNKISCDLTNAESIIEAFKQIDKHWEKIDVFVNCAGIGLEKTLEEANFEDIRNVIETNLLGAILSTKEAYTRMIKRKIGHIINVSSTSGKKAREKETVYCASKWGLAGFNESLRLEARKYNICVTTVYPGGMRTDFYKNNPDKNTFSFMSPQEVAKLIVDLINSPSSICPSELVIERM